jgi:hypothetical protein
MRSFVFALVALTVLPAAAQDTDGSAPAAPTPAAAAQAPAATFTTAPAEPPAAAPSPATVPVVPPAAAPETAPAAPPPAAVAAVAPEPAPRAASLSSDATPVETPALVDDATYDARFQCPETLSSRDARIEEYATWTAWARAAHPDWNFKKRLDVRYGLLRRHGCTVTLAAIANSEKPPFGP